MRYSAVGVKVVAHPHRRRRSRPASTPGPPRPRAAGAVVAPTTRTRRERRRRGRSAPSDTRSRRVVAATSSGRPVSRDRGGVIRGLRIGASPRPSPGTSCRRHVGHRVAPFMSMSARWLGRAFVLRQIGDRLSASSGPPGRRGRSPGSGLARDLPDDVRRHPFRGRWRADVDGAERQSTGQPTSPCHAGRSSEPSGRRAPR